MIQVHQLALINQMLYQKNLIKLRPNYVLVRQTEKVSCKSVTSGKNESRDLLYHFHYWVEEKHAGCYFACNYNEQGLKL